jgi:DNA-binding NtrC family response regulator
MKPKVMIVDDEESFANTLVERLEIRDYNVTASYSGNDALAMLKKLNFDVVILDVAMPGMSGIETLREIKEIKPLTEVIMLTGHATVETAIEGMKLGAMDFLIKPCEAEELMRKINTAYDKKSKHEERIREARVKELISSPMSVFRKNK